jgi:hypothetical protein
MAKIKVRVKAGTKGKPLGERVAQLRTEQGREQKGDKVLYKPKAKFTVHINDGRE